MTKQSQKNIKIIKKRFLEKYEGAKTELEFSNLYELLVCVMLSAQCTDKRVNMITPSLFEKYKSVEDLSNARLEDVKKLINSCSFFNNKSKNLIKMAQSVMENFNGKIPLNEQDLMSLAGVGQKTAHVVLIEYSEANLMAVDTHVFRVSHRLGLSKAKTPEKTEEDLVKAFKTELHTLHQALVLFGRYTCTARNPKCQNCFVEEFCKSKEVFKAGQYYI
ncbi:MAG: endonuclease III [Proteobacteria bacterium]|nr:MAG: endonuclease III [Pseudomonadota bacterium]